MNTAQVIPFRFDAQEVRTLLIDDQPWFCAADVCEVLGYANSRQAIQKNCRPEGVSVRDTLTRGGKQALTFIAEGNLYRLIIKSRKEEAQRFEAWVCDEVLPAIRKHGQYNDTDNRMASIVGAALGATELGALKGVIYGKAELVPSAKRISFIHTMHNRLHTRFNVPRTELIPIAEFADACSFVAAYALEGEWLPREEAIPMRERANWSNINFMINCIEYCYERFTHYNLYTHLNGLGCKGGAEIGGMLRDGVGSARHVKKHCAEHFKGISSF